MGIVKERGEIPANYKVSESLVTPAVVDLERSTTGAESSNSAIVGPLTMTPTSSLSSTTTDAATSSPTAITGSYSSPTKSVNSDYFLWVQVIMFRADHTCIL